ncbi:hypothetical protein [Terracoccus sp. 273MFTsu3.1]|uniref:hypothetical protein n=1 Tax=Terracoccus sp. 273MFTsu3.1 TaxID=1172188 RepID=UPI0003774677|nr:hypothetical protein [Terracoccus sp. 273MFTsu3.1]
MSIRLTHAEFAATQDKVAKINTRAAKRGFTGRFEVVGTPVTVTKVDESTGFEIRLAYMETTITGEAPKYNGWTFLATLDWDSVADGLIVRAFSEDVQVDRDALVKGHCDHCGVQRYRKNTYVVVNEAGEQKQVGSSCIKDFLGHDATVVFITSSEVSEDAMGGGSFGDPVADTLNVLAIAWAATRAFGYVPASAFSGSTKEVVSGILWGRSKMDNEARAAITEYVEGSDAAAVEVRDFILSDAFSGTSDYVLNLKAIVGSETVTPKNIGFLVSAPQAFARAMEKTLIREREKDATADSVHVGTVGDKVEIEATITRINFIESNWGVTVLYTLLATDGNVYKWFASREALGEKQGVEVKVKGTIKDHDEYNGTKSTVLTRCKAL